MSFEVKIPAVGESVASAEIGEWHKKEGDAVAVGDLLVTLETDKVSTEVTAEAAGTISDLAAEGTELEIGAIIARITEGADAPADSPDPAPESSAPAGTSKVESPTDTRVTASPAARQLAKDSDIDLSALIGTGKGGTITKSDVETASGASASSSSPAPAPTPDPTPAAAEPAPAPAAKPASAAKPDESGRTSRKRMSPLRRKIANHLVSAQQTAAILTTFNECDMTAIMKLRKEVQEDFVARNGVKLGFMSFFVKATVAALKAVPSINARIDGEEVVTNNFFDIGVAIGTEKGLIVPVLRDCDTKGFAEIEQDIIDYANAANEGKTNLEDLQGGVFTISNGGVYGSLLSTPILNPPQSGILGMHTIQQRPMAVDGEVVILPMMYLALSYDHRIVDGKEAVTFLIRLKECIENPMRLLVEA